VKGRDSEFHSQARSHFFLVWNCHLFLFCNCNRASLLRHIGFSLDAAIWPPVGFYGLIVHEALLSGGQDTSLSRHGPIALAGGFYQFVSLTHFRQVIAGSSCSGMLLQAGWSGRHDEDEMLLIAAAFAYSIYIRFFTLTRFRQKISRQFHNRGSRWDTRSSKKGRFDSAKRLDRHLF